MCDGYRGYGQEQLPKATFGSCLIHIRRPFIELVKGLTLKNNAQATQAVKLLSRVFHKENNLRYKTPAEKKRSGENWSSHCWMTSIALSKRLLIRCIS